MIKSSKDLLKAAAQLEKDISKLYLLYSELFTDKSDFWNRLAKEEVEHAALVEMAIEFPDVFPQGLVNDQLPQIKETSRDVTQKIQEFKQSPPSNDQACAYALKLESSAWELHYQKLATRVQDSEAIKIFQRLNDGDKDHMRRITSSCAAK